MKPFFRSLIFLAFAISISSFVMKAPSERPLWQERIISSLDKALLPMRLARLQARAPDDRIFMPVEGIRISQVADTWDAPRSGGRRHEGQDIFAPKGTPIRSVVDGYVTRVADSGLGGKHIFVTGAGGRRYYYAHLDAFADISYGDKVSTESIVGYIGNTGNAVNTPPHLHFGLYTNSGAINPLPLMMNREEH